jgi:hypothetical protein
LSVNWILPIGLVLQRFPQADEAAWRAACQTASARPAFEAHLVL